jgi:hypothetical protein
MDRLASAPIVHGTTPFGPLDDAERQRLGRLAGVLLMVGAIATIPAALVLEPAPPWTDHLIGLGSLLTGVAAYFAPWGRLSSQWLHVPMIVAPVEIAIGIEVVSYDYAFYFVLVAMYAAYVVRDRTVLLAYMLFFTLALLAPLAYADDLDMQAHHILVTFPVMLIAAAIVRYLRDSLEQRERQFRDFAAEAVRLAERIRGPIRGEDRLDELARELDR